jgi:hypothetical protein
VFPANCTRRRRCFPFLSHTPLSCCCCPTASHYHPFPLFSQARTLKARASQSPGGKFFCHFLQHASIHLSFMNFFIYHLKPPCRPPPLWPFPHSVSRHVAEFIAARDGHPASADDIFLTEGRAGSCDAATRLTFCCRRFCRSCCRDENADPQRKRRRSHPNSPVPSVRPHACRHASGFAF